MGDQYTLPTIEQHTTVFDHTGGQLKAIYDFHNNDPDDELLKNLLTRLKRFSNKIQTTKRNKVIKKPRKSNYRTTKKTRVVMATNPWTTVKQQKRMPTKIVTYKPSDKVERLLNESRGTCKYLLDYDNLIGTMSCTSTPNTSRSLSRNQTPTRHYDVAMDVDECICMSSLNDHNSKNNECWSMKSSSSGYFSDF
jgi:hypothetical protein